MLGGKSFAEGSALFEIAGEGEKKLTSSNAHSSYFHIGSESGIIGLLLYFPIWIFLFLRVHKGAKLLVNFQDIKAYMVACEALIIYSLMCAVTGHALASPSLMIPVFTIVGMGMAYLRTNVQHADSIKIHALPS